MAELKERTFIAIKPDGVQRGIIGEVIKRFEMKGFKLVGMKMLHVSCVLLLHHLKSASEDLLMKHYIDLKDRPFFPTLINYMSSGPVVAMVRLGRFNHKSSKLNFTLISCVSGRRLLNIIHGSDSVESANKEISLWFKDDELVSYTSCAFSWLY
uniref:Nucleoside diphosphate kinase n=1 Tax=Amphilophus citrinellus TaxID=61819 RepID=A0A3Q0RT85_AMPCI